MTGGINHDDRTGTRGYPLPHPDNTMKADAHRLRDALQAVDADVVALAAATRRRWVLSFIGLKL
jgi:hypothetical protein